METAFGMRALKDLFGFPFRDAKKGMKFLIGSLVFVGGFFVPVLPWIALLGYAARIARIGIEGREPHLPEWDDWGGLIQDGLKLFVVNLLLSLPAVLLIGIGFGSYFFGFFGLMIAQETIGEQAALPFVMLMMFSIFFMFFAMSVGTLLAFAAWFLILPAGAHVVATGRLGAIVELGRWGKVLRVNLGGFALVFFVMFGLWTVQYLVFYLLYMTIFLCAFLPVFLAPLTVYMLAISALMAGQSYREGQEKLNLLPGEPASAQASAV